MLGRWLRALRRSTNPKDLGIPPGRGRRSIHPTQVEIARLAGLTLRAYHSIEQGHHLPNPHTTQALGRALGLNANQISYMNDLTEPPTARPQRGLPPSAVRQLLDAITAPALAYDLAWNVIAANTSMQAISNELFGADCVGLNILNWFFTSPHAEKVLIRDEGLAAELIGQARAWGIRHSHSADLDNVLEDVCQRSPLARKLWHDGTVVSSSAFAKVQVKLPSGQQGSLTITQFQPASRDSTLRFAVILSR